MDLITDFLLMDLLTNSNLQILIMLSFWSGVTFSSALVSTWTIDLKAFVFRTQISLKLINHSIVQNDVTWHENNWDNFESKFLAFT